MFEPNTGCWLWTHSVTKCGGYAQLSVDGVAKRGNRLSYELYKGEIPKGLLVCHTCDMPSCINPDHLFLGTHKDNTMDMIRKGRDRFPGAKIGEKNVNSKLTERDVIKIRKMGGSVQRKVMMKIFKVSLMTLYDVISRKTWTHI